jgi:hypothetical protein
MEACRARRVLRADRRGSSWPVIVETDAGIFHTKLRGAPQAPSSLVAEIIVGALADTLGLSVPARVWVRFGADLRVDDRHEELAQLIGFSRGWNLGFQYLTDAREFVADDARRIETRLASTIVWLDGLVQNPDRTARNPNLLWSQQRLWLIDHGASLGFHHRWRQVTEDSPRSTGWSHRDHVLIARATELPLIDPDLAGLLDRAALERAVEEVPDEFLSDSNTPGRRRAAYVAFLWKRLKEPRPFVLDGSSTERRHEVT